MLAFLARAWFPVGMVLLFVAALPGVALVILALVGWDGAVNAWLKDNLAISYQLALAPQIILLLLLIPIAIVLLYFLKLKRKPLQVPSTFLWRKSIEDLHVNSLLQWLKQNVLLLLQILVVLFFIYSILGLRIHGSTSEAQHYIIVVDNSASMAARDLGATRLQWAKQEALKIVDAANDEDFGMVIVFNSRASTVQAYTNNRAKLRQTIANIEQTQRPTQLEEALLLVDSLANPVRSTEDLSVRPENEKPGEEREYVPPRGVATTVHLLSDGRFPPLSDATLSSLNSRQLGNTSLLGNINLRYYPAGKLGTSNNLGIVGLGAVRLDDKPGVAARLQSIVRVLNFRFEPADIVLRLDAVVDGKLAHATQKKIRIGPRVVKVAQPGSGAANVDEPGESIATLVLPALDLQANVVLHAKLDDTGDDFAVDDQAWFALGRVRKAKVLIVGPNNPVLDAFFDQNGTRKIAAVERMNADQLGSEAYRSRARTGEVDLVIFDRCAPATEADLPQTNTMFIDDVPAPWTRGSKKLANPFLLVSKSSHPLLRYISSLWEVGVTESFRFDPVDNLPAEIQALTRLPDADPKKKTLPAVTKIIETNGALPMLFTLPRGPYTDLVMTFPLVSRGGDLTSNWPLQPSFPIFMRNVLYVLGNVDDAVRTVTVRPGDTVALKPEAGVHQIVVTAPGGARVTLERRGQVDFTYADTEEVGLYQIEEEHRISGKEDVKAAPPGNETSIRSMAVNLFDANESNIEPEAELRFGSEQVAQGLREMSQPRELWKWILVLALILLLVEWAIYLRRVTV